MSGNNRAKEFAKKYRLSAKDMAAIFSISLSLASRWLSEAEEAKLSPYHVNMVETLDLMYEMLRQAERQAGDLRLGLCPAKLQAYEDWRAELD